MTRMNSYYLLLITHYFSSLTSVWMAVRCKFNPSFYCLLAAIASLMTIKPAYADHSLKNAMERNPAIAQAVNQIQSVNQVICDLENSNQTYYYREEKGELGTAWKQIALCYANESDLQRGRQYFQRGGQLGFYGAPHLVGVLVVSYTWENYEPRRLIAIEYL